MAKKYSSSEKKEVISDWEKIIKQDRLVIRFKKTGENHVSLNPEMLNYIYELIK